MGWIACYSWQSDLVCASLARDFESELESLSALLVRLDVLEEVVEQPGLVELELPSGTVHAGKINIDTSGLNAGGWCC